MHAPPANVMRKLKLGAAGAIGLVEGLVAFNPRRSPSLRLKNAFTSSVGEIRCPGRRWTMGITTLTQAKRIVKIMVGFTLLAVGTAMLLLPGPGLVTIAFGLAILSAEFLWARRWLEHLKRHAGTARELVRGRWKG